MRNETERLPSFPIDEVARLPLPGMAIPGNLAFSPDNRWISYTYSGEGGLTRQLYKFDLQTGRSSLFVKLAGGGASEENLSLEEKLRRERLRQYELGVTTYLWSPTGERLLLPLPDGLFIQEGIGGALLKLIGSQEGPLLEAQFSPDGKWISYIQGGELFIIDCQGGTPRQLTFGAQNSGRTHGLAEYIAQEEMGRSRGYWWSPDSSQIAFTEIDETHVPTYYIVHQGKDSTGPEAQEIHHYPFAGQANAKVRLGVVTLTGNDLVWMDLDDSDDIYLARVDWFPEGMLAVQIENRSQTELRLVCFDPANGQGRTLFTEINPVWINLHDLFRPLKDGRFIWGSERTGFRHLYLYDRNGNCLLPITEGEWMVESLVGMDDTRGLVYFTATKESPLESHLYSIGMNGGEVKKITQEAGHHSIVLDIQGNRFIDTHDSIDQPPSLSLRSLSDGSRLHDIFTPSDPRIGDLGLHPPEIVTLKSRDGVILYGALFKPPIEYGIGRFPTIVQVYGGPHVQLVADSWRMTTFMRAQYLSNQGFLVFILDNRGSARRGLAFESRIRHHLGEIELQDQVDGVDWLVSQGLTDPTRVGVYGWSYGGYMSLMCMERAPETFKVGVAGAPVTNWDGYDTHYTERYMGTPLSNPDGYRNSSPMTHIENLRGRLLLVHGLIDENVHFRHTARLINALIKAQKPYDLLLFPDERHGPRRLEDRIYLEERICDFFQENL